MKSRVTGLSSPPSIFWIRPFSTVTSSVQASGQSSGQAVRTVECPHRSAGAERGIQYYRIRQGWVTLPGAWRQSNGGFDWTHDRSDAGGREDLRGDRSRSE